ncbi:unnamed protein product [Discosporangium mesarthrocarpum]
MERLAAPVKLDLENLTYKELQVLAKKNGLRANQKASVLVQCLLELSSSPSEEDRSGGVAFTGGDDPPADEDTLTETSLNTTEADGTDVCDTSTTPVDAPIVDNTEHRRRILPKHMSSPDATTASSTGKHVKSPTIAEHTAIEGAAWKKCSLMAPINHEGKQKTPSIPRSRFEEAHLKMFARQQSIGQFVTKTPRRTGIPKAKCAGPASVKGSFSVGCGARTPSRDPLLLGSASTLSTAEKECRKVGVARKPFEPVIQRSNKKRTTQVREFHLSSSKGAREGFKFKPYTGRIRPISKALSLADNKINVAFGRSSGRSLHTEKNSAPPLASKPAVSKTKGIKGTLNADKAKDARKKNHLENSKSKRQKKLADRRRS